MKSTSSRYHACILLRGYNAAFYRDATKRNRQLHWYFAGKCEGFVFALDASIYEVGEKLREAIGNDRIYYKQGDLKKWNCAQGLIAGLTEILGMAEIALNNTHHRAKPDATQQHPEHETPTNYRLERAKMCARAADLRGIFKPTSPLHHYFHGMEIALKAAHEHSTKELGVLFLAARKDAMKLRRQPTDHEHFKGMAAAYAELTLLTELLGYRPQIRAA
jgi:hypothetical protein